MDFLYTFVKSVNDSVLEMSVKAECVSVYCERV